MTSYIRDHDRDESSLPAINGVTSSVRGSRVLEFNDHGHHHLSGHTHHHHHHSVDEGAKHVRFGPSHQLSGSTSSLNREFVSTSKEFITCRPHSPVHHNKRLLEMEDKLKLFKEELSKKDELITKLTEMDSTSRNRCVDINMTQIEDTYSKERTQALANARSEAAALTVKVDGLTAQLREVKSQLECRDEMIRNLKTEVEVVRENEAKHVAIAKSLREHLVEYEAHQGSFEGAQERNELVISSLKREKEECNSKILELESRIRRLIEEKDGSLRNLVSFESKYRDITHHFTSVLGIAETDIVRHVTNVIEENRSLKDTVTSLKEQVHAVEVEGRASRETIMRLVAEAEEKQSTASKYTLDYERARHDLDVESTKRREMEQELVLMRERLDASQNAWAATRKELEEKESRYTHYSHEIKENQMLVHSLKASQGTFMEGLASLLSDCQTRVEPYECQIKERIQALICSVQDKSSHVDLLDSKLRAVTEQLEKHSEMQKSADRRTKRVESDYFEIEGKLRHMEAELASEAILRDSLRQDKEKYMQFLERVCRLLKLDLIVSDVGVDLASEAIFARCEQIAKMEIDAVHDKQNQLYSLQRKHKSLKEQLESRDLHIDLLRKKVSALEERLAGKTELEREKDTEVVKSKKLLKLVEKYKRELQEAQLEIRDMKAQLLEGSQFRTRTIEAEGHINCLETKVEQLNNVRQKQAEKISHLRHDAESKTENLASSLEAANTTVQSLTRELRTTKTSLDEYSKREKQLLELRQVMARMLGLDVSQLAVPDYEIIARLEKLILAHQSSAATAAAIDSAIVDMEDGFRQGYTQAGQVFVRARSPTRATSRVRARRSRARSLSPQRKKDNRAY